MEVWVNAVTGFRDNSFMPYINYQNEGKAPPPYSPNTSPYNYGLYDTAQPACGTWLNNLHQFQALQKGETITPGSTCNSRQAFPPTAFIPAEIVDKTGRIHMTPPYIGNGFLQYQPLIRHAGQVGNQNY